MIVKSPALPHNTAKFPRRPGRKGHCWLMVLNRTDCRWSMRRGKQWTWLRPCGDVTDGSRSQLKKAACSAVGNQQSVGDWTLAQSPLPSGRGPFRRRRSLQAGVATPSRVGPSGPPHASPPPPPARVAMCVCAVEVPILILHVRGTLAAALAPIAEAPETDVTLQYVGTSPVFPVRRDLARFF